ncbi:aromatic amino acid lyase family protein [Rhodococcus sp. MTM3W5.2]|nr:aromatic amino acid lyase family protein [Rhodococcus sp. MTM3W5.2]
MDSHGPVLVGVGPLTPGQVLRVARSGAAVGLSDQAVSAMASTRAHIEALARDFGPVYGVSTGFGALATRHIPPELRAQLQRSLIRSHAAGSGPEVEREVVRAMMLLRLATLATGRTGARPAVAHTYAALLSAGITPVVPEFGSLGCSGDLAPLAHTALAVTGEGLVRDAAGEQLPAADALAAAGIYPLVLEEKEGLALINGTDGMLGMLVLACDDLRRLLPLADITAAMSVEGLMGTDRVFAADLQALRPHPGQAAAAANMVRLLAGSEIVASHATPTALGPGRLLAAVRATGRGRCPGHPRARRTGRGVRARECHRQPGGDPRRPGRVERQLSRRTGGIRAGLPRHRRRGCGGHERTPNRSVPRHRAQPRPAPVPGRRPGVDSGHMIAQYTQAAIVSELKRLASPASVDSIPSSAMQEDHVSMGWSAARKLRRSIDGLTRVLAIEALTAARGLDLRAPLRPSPATAAVRDAIRARVGGPGPDRFLAPEIGAAVELAASGALLRSAEMVVGDLA